MIRCPRNGMAAPRFSPRFLTALRPFKPRTPLRGFLLARFPAKRNRFAEKDSRQINILEQILIAKVFNFGGICSRNGPLNPLEP